MKKQTISNKIHSFLILFIICLMIVVSAIACQPAAPTVPDDIEITTEAEETVSPNNDNDDPNKKTKE